MQVELLAQMRCGCGGETDDDVNTNLLVPTGGHLGHWHAI